MGQKVNPNIFRVGPTLGKTWESVFYAENNYADLLIEDIKIKLFIKKKYANAQIGRVLIERTSNKDLVINIHTKKVGAIIGKSGADIDKLKKSIAKISKSSNIHLNVIEITKPDADASLLAQFIAHQIEKRVSFRRAMKLAMQNCMKQGKVKGIKVSCSGRLGGAEIARTEWYKEGRVPLHTLRADIDYSLAEAMTTYGVIGIKVWVYKGEYGNAYNKK
jgi:small subunit ribosomal protein S3